jgi:hypothetical protein
VVGLEEVKVATDSGLSCKEVEIALGSVIGAMALGYVGAAKVVWNLLTSQLKAERDHSASLEVTFNSAKQKKAESPQ